MISKVCFLRNIKSRTKKSCKLFYLYNSHEDYIKRSPEDRYVYTKEEYDDLWKFFLIECSKLPIQSFKIDTSKNDLKEVYNIITNLI